MTMTRRNAELLLAALIIARSTSYLFSKVTMNQLDPFNLLAIRFLFAFVVLAVIFRKTLMKVKPHTVWRGMALGAAFFACMSAELFGLKETDTSTCAFLENTAIVFVPLFEAALHRKLPGKRIMASALVTLVGVACLTLKGSIFVFHRGEFLCLLAAAFYAVVIIQTDRMSRKDDALTLGILQIGFMGLFALLFAFIFETPALPQNPSAWGAVAMLIIVCTCFGFTFQPMAQKYTTSERSGIICAVNPLSAGLLGAVFLGEKLGTYGFIGAVLVMAGILIATVGEKTAVEA